jgi:hypothetical protein
VARCPLEEEAEALPSSPSPPGLVLNLLPLPLASALLPGLCGGAGHWEGHRLCRLDLWRHLFRSHLGQGITLSVLVTTVLLIIELTGRMKRI